MTKLLVANWKLNPATETEAVKLAKTMDVSHAVICPPFPFLRAVKGVLRKAAVGAQDVFWEDKGAYTGEVSPRMVKLMGAEYAVVGHSERRGWLKETDDMINKKILAALHAGLKVILCVGESRPIRKKGLQTAKTFVKRQLEKALLKVRRPGIIVAYEPIWAIGTGKPDNPEDTAEMARFIKGIQRGKKPRVLYGGSVTSGDIGRIMQYPEIDGALVGGASLNPREFKKIITITQFIEHGYR